jgi:hypothetical protein
MELLAFASFATLVVAWLVAPNNAKGPLSERAAEERAEAA